MATKPHDNILDNGMIVGYESSLGNFYGYKLLKMTYIPEVAEYRWITQYGSAKRGSDFKPSSDGKELILLSNDDIKAIYSMKWTKDLEFKKGDILAGRDTYGKRVLFVYENENVVHRLTPYNGLHNEQSWASLEAYQGQVKDIKILTTKTSGSKKFSEL